MKYLLVLQFPSSVKSLRQLAELEEELGRELGASAEMDGHDFGSGEGNLFIGTDDPDGTFSRVRQVMDLGTLESLKAAVRETEGEEYRPVWPPGLEEFRTL
jgi:hypothetical protein